MRKLNLLIMAILLVMGFAESASGQVFGRRGQLKGPIEIGNLPDVDFPTAYLVIDGDDATDCSTGEGDFSHICVYDVNTDTWVAAPAAAGGGSVPVAGTQGDILYDSGAAWVALGVGLGGQQLETGGAAANPSWEWPSRKLESCSSNASTILQGTPVFFDAWNASGLSEVDIGDADDATEMPVIGLAGVDIDTTCNGADEDWVAMSGIVSGLDTSTPGWSEGDDLYVTVHGACTTNYYDCLTNTAPTGAVALQKVGQVGRVNAGNGSILVFGAGRQNAVPNIPSANFWLGNASGVATAVTMSGEATMDNAGAVTLAAEVRSMYWPAATFSSDGTNCNDPAEVTINSGPKNFTVICADDDASTIFGQGVILPDSFDKTADVTMELSYVQTAADTAVLNTDIAIQCTPAGTAIDNTWGTEVAIDDAAVTGTNALDSTTSGAIDTDTTGEDCDGGEMLFWRLQLDATGTTTAVATLHFLGIKMEYTSLVGD
jgi:hypothetical protein